MSIGVSSPEYTNKKPIDANKRISKIIKKMTRILDSASMVSSLDLKGNDTEIRYIQH